MLLFHLYFCLLFSFQFSFNFGVIKAHFLHYLLSSHCFTHDTFLMSAIELLQLDVPLDCKWANTQGYSNAYIHAYAPPNISHPEFSSVCLATPWMRHLIQPFCAWGHSLNGRRKKTLSILILLTFSFSLSDWTLSGRGRSKVPKLFHQVYHTWKTEQKKNYIIISLWRYAELFVHH